MGFFDEQAKASAITGAQATEALIKRLQASRMPHQQAFVDDPSHFKVARTARGTGKTTTCSSYFLEMGLRIPKAEMMYITGSLDQAERNLFESPKSGLREMAMQHGVDVKLQRKPMKATFPNGSKLHVIGASNWEVVERARGGTWNLVLIDECGPSINQDLLERMVEEIIEPRLPDSDGVLGLVSSPGYVKHGFFYDVSPNTPVPGGLVRPYGSDWDAKWSLHHWSQELNTCEPGLWAASLAKQRAHGWPDDHPKWMREHLGLWADNTNLHVFGGDLMRFSYVPKPDYPYGIPVDGMKWNFVLGMDFGSVHDTAFVVFAYSDHYPTAYQVYGESGPGMDVDEIQAKLDRLIQTYGGFEAIVADYSGKLVIDTLNRRGGYGIQSADKQDKRGSLEVFEGNLNSGRLKLIQGSTLMEQMQTYQWDKSFQREARHQHDHEIDAALYAQKHLFNDLWRPTEAPLPTDPAERISYESRMDELKMAGMLDEYEGQSEEREIFGEVAPEWLEKDAWWEF